MITQVPPGQCLDPTLYISTFQLNLSFSVLFLDGQKKKKQPTVDVQRDFP